MNDVDHLMHVMKDAFDPYWREAWTRKQVEDSLQLPSTYYLLCDETGAKPVDATQTVGFVLARRIMDEEELLLIGVKTDYRNLGIGNRLLSRFMQEARLHGSKKVFLEMRDRNPAETLYRRADFQPIGRRRNYYRTSSGQLVDAITFARPL